MFRQSILLILVAFLFFSSASGAIRGWTDGRKAEESRCWSNRNAEPEARWYAEGEQIERGTLVYECRAGGKMVPIGCNAEQEGHRLLLPDDTFVSGTILLKCVLSGDGAPHLEKAGCAPEGTQGPTYAVGDSWADNNETKTWWECAREESAVTARLGGCVDTATQSRLRVGESIDRDQTTFECQIKGTDTVEMVPVGCVVNGTQHYRVGSQFQDGDFLYYCKRTPEGVCRQQCVGCVLQGRRMYNGDRARQERAVLQCEVRPQRHALAPVACVSEGGVERAPDCKWSDAAQQGTFRVRRQCVVREGRADIRTLGCVFEKDGFARLTLKPNSFTTWRESMDAPPLGVLCRNTVPEGMDEQDGRPVLETFPVEQMAQRTAGLEEDVEPMM